MPTPWGSVVNGYTLEPYADLRGANLRNQDLQGANLAYANLQGADLRNSNLTFANAWNADFRGADLRNTNFTKTMLRRSNFEGARFGGTYMFNAKMDDCNFRRVNFGAGCDFTRAGLYRANFTEANFGPGENTRLEDAQLKWAYLRKMNLKDTRIGWANLTNADFSDSDLSGKEIGHWQIDGARFQRCNMRGVRVTNLVADHLDFEYANLEDSVFTDSSIHSRISFNNVRAQRAQFNNTFFNINSEWEGADLRYTRWNSSNIRQAIMRATDFTGATFDSCGMRAIAIMGANLNDTRITNCNMREADLRAASLDGAQLSGMDSEDLSMNDAIFTQTYLAGARLSNIRICGAIGWDEAIFEDRDPQTGRTKRAILLNITGPDCYLYHAERDDREDIVPI